VLPPFSCSSPRSDPSTPPSQCMSIGPFRLPLSYSSRGFGSRSPDGLVLFRVRCVPFVVARFIWWILLVLPGLPWWLVVACVGEPIDLGFMWCLTLWSGLWVLIALCFLDVMTGAMWYSRRPFWRDCGLCCVCFVFFRFKYLLLIWPWCFPFDLLLHRVCWFFPRLMV
jgi:hypothetical protein